MTNILSIMATLGPGILIKRTVAMVDYVERKGSV